LPQKKGEVRQGLEKKVDTELPVQAPESTRLEKIARALDIIHDEMVHLEAETLSNGLEIHDSHRQSARNLIHYLALRRHDLRDLQEMLASQALSSLGRAEAHVKPTIEMLSSVVHRLVGRDVSLPVGTQETSSFADWRALLERHTLKLLGPGPTDRFVRIMVTMPSEAAEDYNLVRGLLAEGMDCMRINCAHDGIGDWERMISNLRKARRKTERNCRILMDLPGPKLRTGAIRRGPPVLKWRPHRDRFGRVIRPARIWLTDSENWQPPPGPADASLPVSGEWLNTLQSGDTVRFFDARGASRTFSVTELVGDCRWAQSYQTSYITSGALLHTSRNSSRSTTAQVTEGRVGHLQGREQEIFLKRGDTLILTRDPEPGASAIFDSNDQLVQAARIAITLPEAFSDVRAGERIWLDDGKIGGIIETVGSDEIQVRITHTRPHGEQLMSDKGINLPESNLRLPSLTDNDLGILPFIAKNADLVGYSFVRRASDVYQLQDRLSELGPHSVGIVLKIETNTAFEQLPALLLAAMRSPAVGVMIARGDLAVECGYERMAEVQEELLWICEAAHIPVIWATQVLENLAKHGLPSRAEITDAAMGERAECVMLNKGPYVLEAVRVLDDILKRMQAHQTKKKSMLRSLKIANHFAVHSHS
jgi:pyruvate kinase